jgi:carbamoyl-phosphate synthase small subunit
MVGYPESLTDPSYAGQILVLTYPLVGNYGVPASDRDEFGLLKHFESGKIQVSGLAISRLSSDTSHWSAERSLEEWLSEEGVPGITGVDTRALAKLIREKGAMLGKLVPAGQDAELRDPNRRNLVAEVGIDEPLTYGADGPRVVVVDTGAKESIIRSLVLAGARVLRVPWDHDFFGEEFDAICLPNGPGDPKMADVTISNVRRALKQRIPLFGICLGNQILALAAGADTYKLKFGHRSQNQPCQEVGARSCFVTSQNHGYAVNGATLPEGWREWFVNANDGTNEGIRHDWKPARSVQFHPEAAPGPVDTRFLFERFLDMLR